MAKATDICSQSNLILAALPEDEMHVFRERGDKRYVRNGQTLQEAGEKTETLFFPTTTVLSLLGVTQEGLSVETGLIGQEGMVGLPQYFGGRTQPLQCLVQHSGEVCQIPAHVIREARLSSLQMLLLWYSNYRLIELAQSAICNKFHLVRQRFSRWILTAQDRIRAPELEFTQDMLSAMVGARRPVVATLAGKMQDEGLIRYHRGSVSILDRPGLEEAACECYEIMSDALHEFVVSLRGMIGDS